MIAHARDPVIPPCRLRDEIPSDLERVVLECLAKDPAARFSSAQALADGLASLADVDAWTQERARAWWREAQPTGPTATLASDWDERDLAS